MTIMAVQQRIAAWDEVFAFLVSSPTPEQIIAFRASEATLMRVRYLLDTNRNSRLTDDENEELDELEQANDFMNNLKAYAKLSLKKSSGATS